MLFNLAKEKPTIAQRLMNMLRSAVEAIRRLAASPDQLREYRVMRKAEALLGEAMDAAAAGRGEAGGDVQLSVQQDAQGPYVLVDVDQARFDGLVTKSELTSEAAKVIRERFQGQTIGRENNASRVNARSRGEYTHGPISPEIRKNLDAKMRLSTELDHVMEIARFLRHEDDSKGHGSLAVNGFDYYTAPFEVAGRRFIGNFILANHEDGSRVFYGMPHMQIAANDNGAIGGIASGSARASAEDSQGALPPSPPLAQRSPAHQVDQQASADGGLPVPATDDSIARAAGDVQYFIPGWFYSRYRNGLGQARRSLPAMR
jgi:hypothetical protein